MLRFLAFREIKRAIEENVKTETHRIIFENSTGKSMREVATIAGVSHPTVQAAWEKWAPLGIVVESTEKKGRFERICSLRDVGIEPPPVGRSAAPPTPVREPQSD